jgi:thiamine pyrophosphokinase
LTKAVEWCVKEGFEDIIILGATGLREDHTLANISLLTDYAAKVNVRMFTDSGEFTPALTTILFDSYKGQQISIFSITPDTKITTHGLKYAVQNRNLRNWWQGSLNEAEGNNFTIEFDTGMLIIFKAYMSVSSQD